MNKQVATCDPGTRWEVARKLRLEGKSLSAVAREIGVTRQAVAKMEAKRGWLNHKGEAIPTDDMDPKQAVIANLRRGCTLRVAAGAARVHPNTVLNWRNKDEAFAARCAEAMSLYALDRYNDMARASENGDMRATLKALETHELTRDDFAPRQPRDGLTIVLFSRDGNDHTSLPWPQQPAIEAPCTSVNPTEKPT